MCLLLIVVAHCPFDRSPSGTPADFWAQVQGLLCKFPPSVPVLILADCNAHVGACLTQAIGDVHPEDENQAGAAWHSLFLLHHELAALNTHPQCHVGPSETWFSHSGKGRRLDYIAAPADWRFAATTWVETALENLQMRDDHLPALAHIRLQKAHHTGAFHAPPERRALRPTRDWQDARKGLLVQMLRHRPVLSWHLQVDEHYHCWVEQFHHAWGHFQSAAPQQPSSNIFRPARSSSSKVGVPSVAMPVRRPLSYDEGDFSWFLLPLSCMSREPPFIRDTLNRSGCGSGSFTLALFGRCFFSFALGRRSRQRCVEIGKPIWLKSRPGSPTKISRTLASCFRPSGRLSLLRSPPAGVASSLCHSCLRKLGKLHSPLRNACTGGGPTLPSRRQDFRCPMLSMWLKFRAKSALLYDPQLCLNGTRCRPFAKLSPSCTSYDRRRHAAMTASLPSS